MENFRPFMLIFITFEDLNFEANMKKNGRGLNLD